jgi:hypothetical protein
MPAGSVLWLVCPVMWLPTRDSDTCLPVDIGDGSRTSTVRGMGRTMRQPTDAADVIEFVNGNQSATGQASTPDGSRNGTAAGSRSMPRGANATAAPHGDPAIGTGTMPNAAPWQMPERKHNTQGPIPTVLHRSRGPIDREAVRAWASVTARAGAIAPVTVPAGTSRRPR